MSVFFQRDFWLNLAGACVVATVAAVPVLMSGVMDRGYEIAKHALAAPLAVLALGAVLLAGGWNRCMRQAAAGRFAAASMAVFLVLAAISTAGSAYPEVAIFGGYYRREGLLAWCVYGAFFFAVLAWASRAGRVAALLDVLLLASAIPAAYAVQQRLDLDFYDVVARELTRPGGTLGSPLFLAAYLGLLLPITLVRCWLARRRAAELVLWLAVASMQFCGLLLTQTRGPLLAVVIGLLLLACCAAGYVRSRRIFLGAAAAFAFAVAALGAINTVAGARYWAQEVPVVRRLVFDLDRDAGAETQRASASAAARLAIWGAGLETFAAAPLENKLLGYGPESAFVHYFPHIPAVAVRLTGYEVYDTFDRMHADTLDIGLNFGVLAWLIYCVFFCAVMYVAARALWGVSGIVSLGVFAASACGGGVLAAVAAVQAGLASAAVPAFGLGMGAGWFTFMAGAGWRAAGNGVAAGPAPPPGRWVLLAGLTAALLVFWMDAQVNIPVLTTRLISFAIAALVLIIADGIIRGAGEESDFAFATDANLRVCGVVCALVAACAGFLPATSFSAGVSMPEMHSLRRVLAIIAFLMIAAFAAWGWARRSAGANGGVAQAWPAIVAGAPLFYAAAHHALVVSPGAALSLNHVQTVAIASFAGPACILAACIACAWLAVRGVALAAVGNSSPVSRAGRWSIAVIAVLVFLVAAQAWRATQADVALRLASKVSPNQAQLGEHLIAEAVRLLPYERHYRRQLVFERLGRAVAEIRNLNEAPPRALEVAARGAAVVDTLNAAERAARTAALLFPRDPWVVVALANVLQVAALRVLRPLDPGGGLRAAQEADALFSRVHRMFPGQPLFLRNWAQLRADQGDLAAAYRLLDQMESLIPNEPAPYVERIAIAKQAIDFKVFSETLARAKTMLDPQAFAQLRAVAKWQQD
jgi:O-antigen ligase